MATLAGAYAKLDRASHHLHESDALFEAFLASAPYAVTHGVEADGWYRFRWEVKSEAPVTQLALIYGDMLYNLRAALDYVVWQLVLANGEQPTSNNAFPCVKKQQDWRSALGSKLRHVDKRWAQEIMRLQPFDSSHGNAPPENHFLAVLDHVNNGNKHRLLPVTVLSVEQWPFKLVFPPASPEAKMEFHFSDKPIEHGGELFRFRFIPPVPLSVELTAPPDFRLSFRDDQNLNWYSSDLVAWVRRAISVFDPAFAGSLPV